MRVAMVPLLPCTSIDELAEFRVPMGTCVVLVDDPEQDRLDAQEFLREFDSRLEE